MAKTHLRHPERETHTLCDIEIESIAWKGGALPIAADIAALLALKRRHRCADCVTSVGRAVAAAASAPASEPEPEVPFVAPPPIALSVEERADRERARTLGRTGRRAIERSVRGEALERKWSSAEAAIRAWARGGNGGGGRSAWPEAIRVQSRKPDPVVGMYTGIDRHRNTSLAWQRAFERLLLEAAELDALVPWMLADASLEARIEAARRAESLAWSRVLGDANTEQLAADENTYWTPEPPVTRHDVARIVRHFVGAVHDALVASGEIEERKGAKEGTRDGRSDRPRWDPLRRLRERRARAG